MGWRKANTDDGLGNLDNDMALPVGLQEYSASPLSGFDRFALSARACIRRDDAACAQCRRLPP